MKWIFKDKETNLWGIYIPKRCYKPIQYTVIIWCLLVMLLGIWHAYFKADTSVTKVQSIQDMRKQNERN